MVVVIGLTLASLLLFLRGYQKSLSAPGADARSHAEDLEKQLGELKTSYEALQARAQSGAPTNTSGTTSVTQASGGYFTAIPQSSLRSNLPPREILPFRMESFKVLWKGNTLQFSSAIEYIKDDGGNQQGTFVILARGGQNIYSYPDGTFNSTNSDTLIKPELGEYFSVSRYREVKANFGPVEKHDDIQSIEVLVFDVSKQLIFVERAALENIKAKEVPPPTPVIKKKAPEPAPVAPETPDASGGTPSGI